MKFGSKSKIALVVALMMGQINPPMIDTGYYEEEGDFSVATTFLSGGWGWGVNKAQADVYSDCAYLTDNDSDYQLCVNNAIEHLGTGGAEPSPVEPINGDDSDSGYDSNDSNYSQEGNGGEAVDSLEQAMIDVQKAYDDYHDSMQEIIDELSQLRFERCKEGAAALAKDCEEDIRDGIDDISLICKATEVLALLGSAASRGTGVFVAIGVWKVCDDYMVESLNTVEKVCEKVEFEYIERACY